VSACVLDASLVFPWLFEDEASAEADALLELVNAQGAVAPALWHLECANGLGMAERRGRLTAAAVQEAITLLEGLPLTIDAPVPARTFGAVLALMRTHRLTAYDATYLELAMRLGLPLATGDKALRTAAVASGVALLQVGP
jgi:predicted nucleic acid-binding protein